MKKVFSFFAVAAMLSMAFACKPDGPVDPGTNPGGNGGNNNEPTEETISEITATLEGAGIKTAWAEGDAVIVFAVTESGDLSAKYVLSAGAGTTNGTFKAEGDALKSGATAYYASYPYSSIDFAQHNTFSYSIEAEQNGACPVFGSSADGKAFKFSSPLAGLEIQLTGKGNAARLYLEDNNTNNILNGNVEFNAMTGKIKLKNSSSSKNTVARAFEAVALSDKASSFFMEVPAGTLETGASLTVYNPANGMIGIVEIPAQSLKAGSLTVVGPLALKEVSSVADLSAVESANCYVITEPGDYKFRTVKGNSSENVGVAATAEILWETYGNMETVVPNSIIAEVKYESDYVIFKTPETLHKGNALVCVKDAAGVILWSWHIWVVADQVLAATDLGFGDGTQLLNYNLGGVGEPGTTESFGLLYQWGRKDPFIGGGNLGHSEVATIAGVEMDTTPEQGTVDSEWADHHPTTFVIVTGSDGQKDWLAPSDGTRWATEKAVYDPCPAGWRVPAEGDAPGFFTGDLQFTISYGEEDSDYTVTVNGNKLPLPGSRGYTNGGYSKSDSKYFTCSGAEGEYGKAMRFSGTSLAWGIRRKAECCAIRCAKVVDAE